MAATTNAEVHVAAGRRLHGGRPLHGGEELHGGRAALNDGSVESSAVRWMAPCLLGGDEAVGVGAFSRRRSSQLHRVAGGRRFHGRRQDHGPCENGRGRGGPTAEGGGDPFRCPSATGGGDPCVPRARADVRAQEPSFDRFRSVPNGGRRTARHQTEGDGGRRRPDTGGGGSREEAAARRRRRWPEAGGGGLREAGTRGRRLAEGGVGGRRCCRVRRRKTPGRCDRPVAWTKR